MHMNGLKQQATAYTGHCIFVVLREKNGVGVWGLFFLGGGGGGDREKEIRTDYAGNNGDGNDAYRLFYPTIGICRTISTKVD